jgi:hypothetical protein
MAIIAICSNIRKLKFCGGENGGENNLDLDF